MSIEKKNIHLIAYQHEGGFFSNFNKITTFLDDCYDNIAKITWKLEGQPYGAFAYSCGEVYNKLFKEYETGKPIDNIVNLEIYPHQKFTGHNVHQCYISNDKTWRYSLNKTLQYIKPVDELQSIINKIDNNTIFKDKKVIGILKRNELLKCEQNNSKMPTLDDYYREIDNIFDNDTYLYLAVDNIHDLNSFIAKYKRCIYNIKMRRTQFNSDTEPHFLPGTISDAQYTYAEVYCLSKCDYFIHPLSNMSTAALYFNPELKSIYI